MASFVGFASTTILIRNVLIGGGILFDERTAFEKKEQTILCYSVQCAFRSNVFCPMIGFDFVGR